MSRLPSTTCCRSTPRCARCPVRLALAAQARGRGRPRARLVDEILLGGRSELPPAVTHALAELARARAEGRRKQSAAIL